MTVDGKITTRNFSPVDFTSREDKQHLFRQRARGDAVLIGHTTLEDDNVRLGLPKTELRQERIARGQTPLSASRHRFQRRKNRQSAEHFSIRRLANPHFFDHANAEKIPLRLDGKSDASFERLAPGRSSRNAAPAAHRIQSAHACLRRRRRAFSGVARTRSGRSAQSHDRALSFWRRRTRRPSPA